jgi:hypothetical protein
MIIRFINKNFKLLIYCLSLFISFYLLFSARQYGLLPFPIKGTDQLTMISAAANMYRGTMPEAGYLYSPLYTIFLYLLVIVSQGNLIIMRLLQAALCAFTPVFIYKLARKIRINREASQIAALLYCFYGAAALVSLSFLRAGPLAFCFTFFSYTLVQAFWSRKVKNYIYAGITAALCVLGRESFLPVVLAPLCLMCFKNFRHHIRKKYIVAYLAGIILMIFPFSLYNYIKFQSIAIIPGAFENIFTIFHASKTSRASLSPSLFNSIFINMPIQLMNFFSSYEIPNSLSFYAHKEVIEFMTIFIIPFNLLLGISIAGVYLLKKNKGVLLIALLISSFCGSLLFFNMFYRYRVPVVPLVALLAGAGIVKISHQHSKYRRTIYLLFIFIFFLLTYTNPDKLRLKSERISVGKVLIFNRQYKRAEDYINHLDKDQINTDLLYHLLIASLIKDGEVKYAKRVILKRKNDQREIQCREK